MFELVQTNGEFGCDQPTPGERLFKARQIDDLGVDRGEIVTQSALKGRRRLRKSAGNQRHRSCLWRRRKRLKAGGFAGKSPRKCCEQRFDNRRRLLRNRFVSRTREG